MDKFYSMVLQLLFLVMVGVCFRRETVDAYWVKMTSCADENVIDFDRESIYIDEFPVRVPHRHTIRLTGMAVNGSVTEAIADGLVDMEVTKKVFFVNIPIPCINKFGSCKVPLSEYLPDHSESLRSGDRHLVINFDSVCIGDPGVFVRNLIKGEYRAKIKLREQPSGRVLGCRLFYVRADVGHETCSDSTSSTEAPARNPSNLPYYPRRRNILP